MRGSITRTVAGPLEPERLGSGGGNGSGGKIGRFTFLPFAHEPIFCQPVDDRHSSAFLPLDRLADVHNGRPLGPDPIHLQGPFIPSDDAPRH